MLERNVVLAVAVALTITAVGSANAEPVDEDRSADFWVAFTAQGETTAFTRNVASVQVENPVTDAATLYATATDGSGAPVIMHGGDDGLFYTDPATGEGGFIAYPRAVDGDHAHTGDAGSASADTDDGVTNPVTQDHTASPLPGYGLSVGLELPPLDENTFQALIEAPAFDQGAPLLGEIDMGSGKAPGASAVFRTGEDDLTGRSAYTAGSDDIQYNRARTNARATTPALAGATGMNLATAAAAAAAAGLFIVAPLMLYHRIKKDRALDNETRKRVYDCVMAEPGAAVQSIADRVGVSYSTTAYHLGRLMEERMLVTSSEGGKVRYYKNGGASEDERRIVSIMKDAEAMKVLELIQANPWCYRAEIAEMLKVSSTAVNWHLKKLLGAGLVKEQREGRNCYLYADRQLIERFGELQEKVGLATPVTHTRATGFEEPATTHAVPVSDNSPFAA